MGFPWSCAVRRGGPDSHLRKKLFFQENYLCFFLSGGNAKNYQTATNEDADFQLRQNSPRASMMKNPGHLVTASTTRCLCRNTSLDGPLVAEARCSDPPTRLASPSCLKPANRWSQLRFPGICFQRLRATLHQPKNWVASLPQDPRARFSAIAFVFGGFHRIGGVRCSALAPIRNEPNRCASVVGLRAFTGQRLTACCWRLLRRCDGLRSSPEVISTAGEAAACRGVLCGGRTGW